MLLVTASSYRFQILRPQTPEHCQLTTGLSQIILIIMCNSSHSVDPKVWRAAFGLILCLNPYQPGKGQFLRSISENAYLALSLFTVLYFFSKAYPLVCTLPKSNSSLSHCSSALLFLAVDDISSLYVLGLSLLNLNKSFSNSFLSTFLNSFTNGTQTEPAKGTLWS